MATITKGYTFGATELVTNTKLHSLVDSATISDIANTDLSILTQVSMVNGNALFGLENIPSAAGSIPNANIAMLTMPSMVFGGAFYGLDSIPSAAGVIPSANVPDTGVADDGTVNPTNLLSNGDFESWSAGTSAAPDGWTEVVGGGSIAREATIIKLGTYSAKLTRATDDEYIYQYVHTPRGIAYWKGRKVTFGCWVYATVASRARISINDGVTETYSSYHTGGSAWEWLTISATIEATATNVGLFCWVNSGDTSAYFDGAICVEGESAFAFSPKPPEEGVWADYGATSTVVGWTSFTTKSIYTKKIGKTAFVSYSLAGVSDSTAATFTVPYTSSNTVDTFFFARSVDNSGTNSVGRNYLPKNSSTVTLYKDAGEGNWTDSDTKSSIGIFFYETA